MGVTPRSASLRVFGGRQGENRLAVGQDLQTVEERRLAVGPVLELHHQDLDHAGVPVGLAGGGGHPEVRRGVAGRRGQASWLGHDADDPEALEGRHDREIVEGRAALVEGGEDPSQLLLGEQVGVDRAPDLEIEGLGGPEGGHHLVGVVGIGRAAGEVLEPGERSRPMRPDGSAMKLTDGVSTSTPSSVRPAAASTDSAWVSATPGSAATSSKSTEAKSKVPGMPLTTMVWWTSGLSTKRSTAESDRRAPATRARANPAERPMTTATASQAPARRRRSAWNRYRRNDPPPPRITPSVAQRRGRWRGGGPSPAGVATPPPGRRPRRRRPGCRRPRRRDRCPRLRP